MFAVCFYFIKRTKEKLQWSSVSSYFFHLRSRRIWYYHPLNHHLKAYTSTLLIFSITHPNYQSISRPFTLPVLKDCLRSQLKSGSVQVIGWVPEVAANYHPMGSFGHWLAFTWRSHVFEKSIDDTSCTQASHGTVFDASRYSALAPAHWTCMALKNARKEKKQGPEVGRRGRGV